MRACEHDIPPPPAPSLSLCFFFFSSYVCRNMLPMVWAMASNMPFVKDIIGRCVRIFIFTRVWVCFCMDLGRLGGRFVWVAVRSFLHYCARRWLL